VRQSTKTILVWGVLILFMVMCFQALNNQSEKIEKISFTQFIHETVGTGTKLTLTILDDEMGRNTTRVAHIEIRGMEIHGKRKDGTLFQAIGDVEPFIEKIIASGVQVNFINPEEGSFWKALLITWFPFLLLMCFLVFFLRQFQSGSKQATSFGKSKHRMLDQNGDKVTFRDVAGAEEAKEELEEIVEFLMNPSKFTKLGGRIPRGCLLLGPPGTGKTLLAKATAGEAGVPFFTISGSEFVEMFVGVGAARVRDLFDQAKNNAPCIIFIDEIDAVGRHRGAGVGGGHDEREQTLNQLLVEMDGFESQSGVIIMAATNRPDVLDPALLRPGRFDRRIAVSRPDILGREKILEVHTRRTPLAETVKLAVVARATPGFTGADLENLVNEAALLAARRGNDCLEMDDFEMSKDKVLMGVARYSMVLSDKERRTTAWHEAGHALVAQLIDGPTDPVHKVTIIPRGRALGLTQQVPEEDRHSYTREYVSNRIAVALGGRIAEELQFKEKTTGAGNDFVQATELARKMVCDWGMSELGTLALGQNDEPVFLGMGISQTRRNYSEKTAQRIDDEVGRIVAVQYDRARKVLEENQEKLDAVAEALLEWETLDTSELNWVLAGKDLNEL
jgi:cell division protease FtsH